MKKIAILGLHLYYGGVEQSIITQANALCDNYDVELAITYKMDSKPAFEIDKRVKVVYLTNLKPNKKEFISNIKRFNIIGILKEGFKSIKILMLKKKTMIDYIKSTDADIVISSRVEITELLNKYKKNYITIAEEHRHHNNDLKYIKRLKTACDGIDYLVSVSKELNDFYTKNLINVKCIYIPNGLQYWPIKTSNLKSKNLIAVGRLSKEKGFSDLIDVMYYLCKLDDKFHLDLIGDGNEYASIKDKIISYGLEKNVTMHGFKNKSFINEKLLKSSIYLMSSFEESFGIVLIEAGSFGLPSIAFDSAQGAKEIITNNKNGYLIENRNKELMAKKIFELYQDKEKLNEFSKEARNASKEYSFENIKRKWNDFIRSLL